MMFDSTDLRGVYKTTLCEARPFRKRKTFCTMKYPAALFVVAPLWLRVVAMARVGGTSLAFLGNTHTEH